MKFDILNIIKQLPLNFNEFKQWIISVDNEKHEINFNDEGAANVVLDTGIDMCWDYGIKVLVNGKQIGWF